MNAHIETGKRKKAQVIGGSAVHAGTRRTPCAHVEEARVEAVITRVERIIIR